MSASSLISKSGLKKHKNYAFLFHKINQNQRAYIFEITKDGDILSFTKVGLTDKASIGIQSEHKALSYLKRQKLPIIIPKVINFHEEESMSVLTTAGLSSNFNLVNKTENMGDQILQRIKSLALINGTTILKPNETYWFESTMPKISNSIILKYLKNIDVNFCFEASPAHCDIGSENVFVSNEVKDSPKNIAIVDWESFNMLAPIMTDEVSFWLGTKHRKFKSAVFSWGNQAATKNFVKRFGVREDHLNDALLALIFLASIGNDLAVSLCGIKK